VAERIAELGTLTLTVLAWSLVGYVIIALPISPAAQAVLYTAGFVALAGSTALFLELYHSRANRRRGFRPGSVHFLGTGMRFAVAVEFGLWLHTLRMLTVAYVVSILAGFLILELLFHRAGAIGRDSGRAGKE
jgi:hypothetical protein